jgi:hypothetical protein
LLWLFWRQGLTFYPGQPGWRSFYFRLPIAEITGVHYHPQLFSAEMGSGELFAQDASNCDLSHLSLTIS